MKIDLHVYEHPDEEVLIFLKKFKRDVMGKLEDFQDAFAQVDAETTRIGDLIIALTDSIDKGDLTTEQEAAQLDLLRAAGTRLKSVGVSVENPVPPVE